jgi:NADPH:quinone reductase-like Zn-dependent oxidoreductase
MKAAIVRGAGEAPVYGDFDIPIAGEGERLIRVSASALSPLTRARASGTHYSSAGGFPFVAGVDGVGTADGQRVYFVLPRAPFGGMAEHSVAPAAQCVAVPDGLADADAAAFANPGMSSWAALSERARFESGETVLVNGATGSSGRLAVQIARHRGAARVIATGRDEAALAELGADATVSLNGDADALEARFKAVFADGIDVVLDYLWGPSAHALLIAAAKAGPEGRAIRVVQIGTASGAEIPLPGAVLRSSAIELMGSGIGSVPLERLVAAVGGVFGAAVEGALHLPIRTIPLADVGEAWAAKGDDRLVFTIP